MKQGVLAAIVVLLGCLMGTAAMAGQENYGCGLGSMFYGEDDTLAFQLLAVCTNASFGSQVFGISSGTSNCEKPESLVFNKKLNKFVADNMDHLAADMARGQGEYLATLAVLMEVPENKRPRLYSTLQARFNDIYTSPNVTHKQVLKNIALVTKQDYRL